MISFARNAVAATAFVLAAGCTTPSIRTVGDTSTLNVKSVFVDTSALTTAVNGRTSTLTVAEVNSDITDALKNVLATSSDPDGVASDVSVAVESVDLAPPITRVAAGTSSITATVTVTEQVTGRTIVPPTQVTGNTTSLRAVGAIGLVTTRSVDQDYRATLAGFASTVRTALFGPEPQ